MLIYLKKNLIKEWENKNAFLAAIYQKSCLTYEQYCMEILEEIEDKKKVCSTNFLNIKKGGNKMYFQNNTIIEGRICNDIELKKTQSGKSYTRFTVCFNKPKKLSKPDENGKEWTSIPKFFTVIAWNKTAENTAKNFKKGEPVSVIGELDYSEWTDENNEKHNAVSILAKTVRKLILLNQNEQTENQTDKYNETKITSEPEPEEPSDYDVF